ncbi:MAG: anti-sigma F factor [Clostridia bacterium]|nr:anti-sigma F factor [Clostridia bacterium]
MKNVLEAKFKAIPENEAFARNLVANFILPLNPTIEELSDIKTAVSEAVTNVVVHAYPDKTGNIAIKVSTENNKIFISISDNGVGIQDIERALTPFYTSKPDEERSGMGFTVMEGFMDKLEVVCNKGVTVNMYKSLDQEVVGL